MLKLTSIYKTVFSILPKPVIHPLRLAFQAYRKNYYLPLPNKKLFLPLQKNFILTNVSGLATIDSFVRDKLSKDNIFFRQFSSFILLEICKILFYLFTMPFSQINFINNISKCFSITYTLNYLKNNETLYDLVKKRQINICQHLLTILCNKFKIDVSTLQKLIKDDNIDFTLYNKSSINLIIESFILKENIGNNYSINIKAIDHQNITIDALKNFYNSEESFLQIKQKNADFLFYHILNNPTGINEIIRLYRDVKASFHGVNKGHFILIPYLYSDINLAIKYMRDHISFLTQKILQSVENKFLLDVPYKKLKLIQKACNNEETIKNSILNFNSILLELSLHIKYKNLNLYFTIASDIPDNTSFNEDILPGLLFAIEKHHDLFDVDVLFPKNNEINFKEFKQNIIKIIDALFPKDLQDNLQRNLKKFIENNDDSK